MQWIITRQCILTTADSPFKSSFYEVYYVRPEILEDLTFLEFRKGLKYIKKDPNNKQKVINSFIEVNSVIIAQPPRPLDRIGGRYSI